MSHTSTVTLTGKSPKTYLFYCYPLNSTFAKAEGLYLFSKLAGNTHNLVYLGMTQDLSSRFTDHHKEECIDDKGANTISIHWLSGKQTLLDAETDILGNYSFACNERGN
jgi:hypothetical protein